MHFIEFDGVPVLVQGRSSKPHRDLAAAISRNRDANQLRAIAFLRDRSRVMTFVGAEREGACGIGGRHHPVADDTHLRARDWLMGRVRDYSRKTSTSCRRYDC